MIESAPSANKFPRAMIFNSSQLHFRPLDNRADLFAD
jgi:hypothetical protein